VAAQKSSGQAEKPAWENLDIMTTVKPRVFRTGGKQRRGKGFSREEIKKADSNPAQALRLGVPMDFKRKTVHKENVEALKTFLVSRREAAKPENPIKPKIASKPARKTKN
jgi:ribosomal protein L13E